MNFEELERIYLAAKAQGQLDGDRVGQAIELSVAIDTFILDCKAGGLSEATAKWYATLLGAFSKAFPGALAASISTNQMRQYIVGLQERQTRFLNAPQRPEKPGKLSAASIIGHSTALRAFWAWAAREYGIGNPMATIKRPRRQKPAPKAIAASDFIELFNACGDDEAGYRNRALLAFLADAGVRNAELCSLTKEKLLLPEQQALVIGKGSKTRIVVYTKYTRALLSLWLSTRSLDSSYVFTSLTTGDGLTTSGVDQILSRLKKTAGVRGRVNPHSFRHAFAREYLRAGGNVIRLAQLMGHDSTDTTAAYYAIFTPDELADMHEDYSPLRRMMEAK